MAWNGLGIRLGLALAALLVACDGTGSEGVDGGPDGAPADGTVEPRLVVGTGETQFEPLTEGQELPLYMGMQGGWHVFGGVRAYGVSPEGAILSYALEDPGSGEPVTLDRFLMLAEDRVLHVDGHWERFGDLVVINGVDTDVLGRTLELVATLEPANGPVLSDRETVVVVDGDAL